MKIESQVTNLELSRKLKELGVKQRSIFYWRYSETKDVEDSCDSTKKIKGAPWELWKGMTNLIQGRERDILNLDGGHIRINHRSVSAFTVAEHGEELPEDYFTYRKKKLWYGTLIDDKARNCANLFKVLNCDDTEANARAKMRIYLIENELLKL